MGFRTEALEGDAKSLLNGLEDEEINTPFIAHIVTDEGMEHFVVVCSFHNHEFVLADPAHGRRVLSEENFFEKWTGHIITFVTTKNFVAENYTKGQFSKFFKLLRGQYKKIAIIILASILVALIGVVGSFIFEISIDEYATQNGYEDHEHSEEAGKEEIRRDNLGDDEYGNAKGIFFSVLKMLSRIADKTEITGFHVIFIIVILFYILKMILELLRGYLIVVLAKQIDIGLTLSYYNHILDLPVSSVNLRQTGEYLSRFSDTDAVRTAISNVTITLVIDSIMAIGSGILLYLINGKMFLCTFFIVLSYAIIFVIYRDKIENSNRTAMENEAQLQAYFKESIDGMETVKAANAGDKVKEVTTKKFTNFINAVFRNNIITMSQDVVTNSVELIGIVIVLWLGFTLVFKHFITIGILMTFYVLVSYFVGPVKNLIQMQPAIQKAFVAMDRLNDIFDLKAEENTDVGSCFPIIDELIIEKLHFRYGNREKVLRNINMKVRRGEKVAIVGESGSGKTTLAKLLLGFYKPEMGKIYFNDNPIEDISKKELRKNVAYVEQNTFLFADTIRNNLIFGNEDAQKMSDEQIHEACCLSRAEKFINELPLKYDTPLDENGNNLSGGQKQRLSIARALLRRPQVLILDEATSNLDTITENGIKNAIFQNGGQLMCIIIAHRLSTIKQCDRIFVLEKGTIAEEGTHKDLMKKNGLYAKLWKDSGNI